MRSIRAVLEGMTGDPDWKMKGWELGGRPDPLPEKEDDELVDHSGPVDF